MFKVEQKQQDGIIFFKLVNSETGEFAEIAPGLGATVYRIGLAFDGTITDILAPEPMETLEKNTLFRGRILFPFNDRIKNGTYRYGGASYQLEQNCEEDRSALHGLVFDKQFSMLDAGETNSQAEVVLCYSIEKDRFPGYPFPVSLTLTYRLQDGRFSVLFHVANEGKETVPLSFGWHPYFTFDGTIDRAELLCDGDRYIEVGDDLFPSGNKPATKGSRFDFTSFRSLEGLDFDVGITAPESGKTMLRQGNKVITMEQDTSVFNYTWLFTPPDHNSIAIEPVTSATDSFNMESMGRIDLPAGEEINTGATVTASISTDITG